jgi:hypothetical protein
MFLAALVSKTCQKLRDGAQLVCELLVYTPKKIVTFESRDVLR